MKWICKNCGGPKLALHHVASSSNIDPGNLAIDVWRLASRWSRFVCAAELMERVGRGATAKRRSGWLGSWCFRQKKRISCKVMTNKTKILRYLLYFGQVCYNKCSFGQMSIRWTTPSQQLMFTFIFPGRDTVWLTRIVVAKAITHAISLMCWLQKLFAGCLEKECA